MGDVEPEPPFLLGLGCDGGPLYDADRDPEVRDRRHTERWLDAVPEARKRHGKSVSERKARRGTHKHPLHELCERRAEAHLHLRRLLAVYRGDRSEEGGGASPRWREITGADDARAGGQC